MSVNIHTSPLAFDSEPGSPLSLPIAAGVGLRHPHISSFLAGEVSKSWSSAPWLEVHSENYVNVGGQRLDALLEIHKKYPISCHGVGLSLGSAEGLDSGHLKRLKQLYDLIQPAMISEHLSWSVTDKTYLNDLLPLPYTNEALKVFVDNVNHAQDTFGRQILVENPTAYLRFSESTMGEETFICEVIRQTGCGLLLDVNNVYVNACNHHFDPMGYITNLPLSAVGEIHVAGHSVDSVRNLEILIDDHASQVIPEVWSLLNETLQLTGPHPVLVEWDNAIPTLDILLDEAAKAQKIITRHARGEHTYISKQQP